MPDMLRKWILFILVSFAVVLLVVVPLVYWWNHDHLTKMQVFKVVWKTELLGLIALGLARLVAPRGEF